MALLLFALQHRASLLASISSNPEAAHHFSNCLVAEKARLQAQARAGCRDARDKKSAYASLLVDLFKDADSTSPLFDISVLLQAWMLLVFNKSSSYSKEFLRIMTLKITQQHSENLYAAMLIETQFEQFKYQDEDTLKTAANPRSVGFAGEKVYWEYLIRLHASLNEFGQMIGIIHSRLGEAIEETFRSKDSPTTDNEDDLEMCAWEPIDYEVNSCMAYYLHISIDIFLQETTRPHLMMSRIKTTLRSVLTRAVSL